MTHKAELNSPPEWIPRFLWPYQAYLYISTYIDIIRGEGRYISFSAISLSGFGTSSFQSPSSPVLCLTSIFTPFSFMSFLVTSLHLSFGFLDYLLCPLTPMYSLLHLPLSFSPYVLTISVSHLKFSHLFFFATPAIALISSVLGFSILFITIIYFNIIIYVLSSKSC